MSISEVLQVVWIMSTDYQSSSHFSAIYLGFFAILCCVEKAISTDTLTISQFLTHNETLISAQNEFILGFFSPGKSNKVFLGVWFNVIPTQYVWIANRESALNDTSGVLGIGKDGNLVVLDGAERIIWSSGVKNLSPGGVVAQILDTGNLVLRNGDGESSVVWESFDHPSHALIAEMKLGWDLRRGLNRNLTSWRSSDDPSIGEYTYGFSLYGLPQLFIWKGVSKRYRSGPWNGEDFGGITAQAKLPFASEAKVGLDEVYYEHHLSDNSSMMVGIISDTGVYQVFQRDRDGNDWRMVVKAPLDFCGDYMFCGNNSVCGLSISQPCNCITGNTPVNPREWDVGIWSGGCKLEKALNCSERVKFEEYADLKMPDLLQFKVNTSMSLIECQAECLRNCSCTAYANSDVAGYKHGCLLWFGDLVDVRKLLMPANQTLFVRASGEHPEIHSGNKQKIVIIVAPTVVAAIFLLLVVSTLFWKKMSRRGAGEKQFGQGGDEETLELPFLDVSTVSKATQNFNESNRIGEGGFGPVYKGKLPSGQEIAVKRLSEDSSQGITEFKNEVMLIAKLQHRNLVRLLGYCIHDQEKMLIYEYMPNGSLDSYIFGMSSSANSHLLVWTRRFDIIVGIARGLLYLHRDSRLRIIHRDLKASNVLLDNEMNPKISDFGMARTFGEGELAVKTRRVVGTYGYMAPEYAIDGIYSMKSDVFSFGVLVLEVVSGKKNNQFQHQDHDFNLLGHAWKLWLEGKTSELIDPLMEDPFAMSEVMRCIQVGLLCVQKRPDDRPTMSSVLLMLDRETAMLPQPNHPGYFTERVIHAPDTSSSGTIYSSNDLTNSMIQGR